MVKKRVVEVVLICLSIANSKMKEDSIFNIMQFKITDLGYENVTLTNRKYIKIH